MSRSGYNDEGENWGLWRGAVERAILGKRGQAFLREMAAALDAMPIKELIADEIVNSEGQACAIGAVALARQLDVSKLDPFDQHDVATRFGIAPALAAEIAYMNDEGACTVETPAQRWTRIRKWVSAQILSR